WVCSSEHIPVLTFFKISAFSRCSCWTQTTCFSFSAAVRLAAAIKSLLGRGGVCRTVMHSVGGHPASHSPRRRCLESRPPLNGNAHFPSAGKRLRIAFSTATI